MRPWSQGLLALTGSSVGSVGKRSAGPFSFSASPHLPHDSFAWGAFFMRKGLPHSGCGSPFVSSVQVSLARLGAGFGSALADIIPNRIPAVSASLRSAPTCPAGKSERPLDVLRPHGAFISVGDCNPPLRRAG